MRAHGWLFGLVGSPQEISGDGILLRTLRPNERLRIIKASQDFFAKDAVFWSNCVDRFPFVFEKTVPEDTPTGGFEPTEITLSLLGSGEVRCPVQWQERGQNQSSASSSSEVIEYMFRFMNGRYDPISIDQHAAEIRQCLSLLGASLRSVPDFNILDRFLIDRVFSVKRHVMNNNGENFISRAADICICLEYLFQEGSTSDIQFRLALSLAWLLEDSADRREAAISAINKTYSLRSKHVHGVRVKDKSVKDIDRAAVKNADVLRRRALLAKLVARSEDSSWLDLIKNARLGRPLNIDRIGWLTS